MRKQRRCLAIACMVVLGIVLLACQAMEEMARDVADMTPKQRAAWMMSTYNDQYDDYLVKVAMPNLSNEEKRILRAKKETLTTVYPLMQAYDMLQASGKPPTEESMDEIMDLIADLTALVIRE